MRRSLVYRSIPLYRLVMNVLYAGGYRRRFQRLLDRLGDDVHSVCELCFGDTLLADGCRARGITWIGLDVNHGFCERARRQGHDAREGDLRVLEFPPADVYVMAGSLYHFHQDLGWLLARVLASSRRFVLSEPVRNLSSTAGVLGKWAARSANPGTGDAGFRYDEQTLLHALREQRARLGFQLEVVSRHRDIIVEMRH